jgi:hypothetical protein
LISLVLLILLFRFLFLEFLVRLFVSKSEPFDSSGTRKRGKTKVGTCLLWHDRSSYAGYRHI